MASERNALRVPGLTDVDLAKVPAWWGGLHSEFQLLCATRRFLSPIPILSADEFTAVLEAVDESLQEAAAVLRRALGQHSPSGRVLSVRARRRSRSDKKSSAGAGQPADGSPSGSVPPAGSPDVATNGWNHDGRAPATARIWRRHRGDAVAFEAVRAALDRATADLALVAPTERVLAQLPELRTAVKAYLGAGDPRFDTYIHLIDLLEHGSVTAALPMNGSTSPPPEPQPPEPQPQPAVAPVTTPMVADVGGQ